VISRRKWLALTAIGGVASASAYPLLIEPLWLELTDTEIDLKLAAPLRILHLADFHASFLVPVSHIHHAIEIGLLQRPDVICLTGDFITFKHDFDPEVYVRLLRMLTTAAPTYAVLGNHDGGSWAPEHGGLSDHKLIEQILSAAGVRLLHNDSESITVRGCALSIVGVGDLWSNEIEGERAFAGVNTYARKILLAHNPDSKELLRDHPWDLMLSGHTHGGQVIVPFAGPCYAPVRDKTFIAGLNPWNGRQIFVTRGVGNLGGVRFRCRPEVSILRLV
jgi:uncharacterized protein